MSPRSAEDGQGATGDWGDGKPCSKNTEAIHRFGTVAGTLPRLEHVKRYASVRSVLYAEVHFSCRVLFWGVRVDLGANNELRRRYNENFCRKNKAMSKIIARAHCATVEVLRGAAGRRRRHAYAPAVVQASCVWPAGPAVRVCALHTRFSFVWFELPGVLLFGIIFPWFRPRPCTRRRATGARGGAFGDSGEELFVLCAAR